MSVASLAGTARKAAAGSPISEEEARQLLATTDLVSVGMVATDARRVRVGDRVTFVRVAEIAVELATAVTAWAPDAGAGAVRRGAVGATGGPVLPALPPLPPAAREMRITGTPPSAAAAIAAARAVAVGLGLGVGVPSGGGATVPLTAFSLADLWELADAEAKQLHELSQSLRQVGVMAIAEVPVDQFTSTDAVAAALDAVSSAGLLAPVATWREAPEDPVASLLALHALQERSHAFRAFAPLPPQQSAGAPSTGYEDVKIIAVARTMLHNIDHIQVDWTVHGPKLAQVALLFGASDLDRVATSDDAPLGHRRAPLEEVQRNITSAFLNPIERDGRFEQVMR